MKAKMTWPRLALMLLTMLAACDKCYPAVCECTHHAGGCVINLAAPAGFKCRCIYKGFWTCSASAFPCVGEELCPGNQADSCACQLGKGNCGGYWNPSMTCEGSGRPKPGLADSAQCSCQYHRGGCTINIPAPFGWKCVCVYKGGWTCSGWAQQCNANEVCLGDDYSYCGCKQGSGNCGGYPDKPSCPSNHVSTSCNCNRASDWTKGLYTIDNVTYDSNNIQTHSLKPIALAEKDILNPSGETQSIDFRVQKSMRQTSSFSNTRGIRIQAGTGFSAGIPIIGQTRFSFTVTSSFSHNYGKTESMETLFQNTFTCNGAPYKHTMCTVIVKSAKLTVPYTMIAIHKVISDCSCESYGVWTGIQSYHAQLITKEMEN